MALIGVDTCKKYVWVQIQASIKANLTIGKVVGKLEEWGVRRAFWREEQFVYPGQTDGGYDVDGEGGARVCAEVVGERSQ